jgi:betaine-aldehyde dehydrogenase
MKRVEPEDLRRRQLIEATIDTMATEGFAATTLALIGQKAKVSPGLIAHYFDDKDGLLEATLRSLASRLARGLSTRLRVARTPRERVHAVIDTTLAPEEFDARTTSVWLAFWGQVIHSVRLKRVQKVYQGRLLSNLRHGLKQIVPAVEAERLALAIAAMIDGLWRGARHGERIH